MISLITETNLTTFFGLCLAVLTVISIFIVSFEISQIGDEQE